MKSFTVEIPEEVVNELERCQYEVNSRQGVIDRYLEKHMNDADGSAIDAAPFKHFMSLLAECEAEYEMVKEAITENYVPDVLKEHQAEWNLDFHTHILTINILCDCEIEGL